MRLRLPAAALTIAAALAACTPPPAPGPSPAPAPATPAAGFAAALDSIFADSLFARAQWGVVVRSLDARETLYRRNGEKMFVPASNMKIVTAAAALEALGPDWRFRTSVEAEGEIADGRLRGNLVVRGGGDPTFAERFGGDANAVFRDWGTDSLHAHGVRHVNGALVGNDDVFDDVPFGRGWAWDDIGEPYSAEVGGLQFNEGMATIRITPRRPGERPLVGVRPSNEHVRLLVLATTAPAGTPDRLEVVRVDSVAAGFIVRGSIPADTPYVDREIAVPDNTLYFLHALRPMLGMSGVPVDGPVVDDDARQESDRRPTRTLFVHHSPPLSEVLKAFLEPSQNQYGEILLKTLGRELRGAGTSAAGVAAVDSLMRAWGMPPRALYQADGSGLSRYNLVAPDLLVALLEHMARSPRFLLFREALPTGGREGTLERRMRGTPLEGNVTAKTGTLSGVRSLSGYLTTAAGERMVFSMIVNNHTATARDADRLAEAALLRLYHLPRAR